MKDVLDVLHGLKKGMALAGSIVVLVLLWTAWLFERPLSIVQPIYIDVPSGRSVRGVADHLAQQLSDLAGWQWRVLVMSYGTNLRIRAGRYSVGVGMTPVDVITKMSLGDIEPIRLQVLEGWRFQQMRQLVDQHADLRHDSKALSDTALLQYIGATRTHPEGLFFPDTYHFLPGTSDLVIYRQAYDAMQKQLGKIWAERQVGLPLKTPYELLILASIVEKETGSNADRALIARVFLNRLALSMHLQTDPTVIYGLGSRFDGDLHKRDLLSDTAYNTYIHGGLPPSPIAVPSRASLLAVAHPAPGKVLYFVARGDGTSEFSETLEAHNRAVSRYQLHRERQ